MACAAPSPYTLRMGSCVTTHALVSALVSRIEKDGYAPTRADFVALLRAGTTRVELETALSRPGAGFAEARAILATASV